MGARAHNLHLHGRHDVAQDGWQPLPPGAEHTYRIRAEPYGLHPYHGAAGFFERYPIKVPVGALVRVYLLNMLADDPVASFHLLAETFDVYRSDTRLVPDERTDVVTLAQTERAIVEFRLPARGLYMFHPHRRRMAERGAMGWFAAIQRSALHRRSPLAQLYGSISTPSSRPETTASFAGA